MASVHVSDLAMRRQQGKAVVTFSSLETEKEEEIASTCNSDALLTPSPLTITARGVDLDVSGTPTDLLPGSVSPEPLQPSHQHTSSPTGGDGIPTVVVPASRHVPATPNVSSLEPSSSCSYVTFKPDGRRTRLRVPASKLREIPSPRSVHSSAKTAPHQLSAAGEQQCLFFFSYF